MARFQCIPTSGTDWRSKKFSSPSSKSSWGIMFTILQNLEFPSRTVHYVQLYCCDTTLIEWLTFCSYGRHLFQSPLTLFPQYNCWLAAEIFVWETPRRKVMPVDNIPRKNSFDGGGIPHSFGLSWRSGGHQAKKRVKTKSSTPKMCLILGSASNVCSKLHFNKKQYVAITLIEIGSTDYIAATKFAWKWA